MSVERQDRNRDVAPEGATAPQPGDSRATRERRLKIRCWRRGTKEMDLILGGFFDREGASLEDAELAQFEALIEEDDAVLYRWATGAEAPPERHRAILERIQSSADRERKSI